MSIFDEENFDKEAQKITNLQKKVTISIRIPPVIALVIDSKRGDVGRSLWIQRQFEKWFARDIEEMNKELGLK